MIPLLDSLDAELLKLGDIEDGCSLLIGTRHNVCLCVLEYCWLV